MEPIEVFTADEERIISCIKSALYSSGDSLDYRRMTRTLSAIHSLADSISKYPSLLNEQLPGKNERSIDMLVETIYSHTGLDLILNTPTKALLGRNFAIAKMNLFLLMIYLCNDFKSICHLHEEIKQVVYFYVFSVMTEDVFISIISDREIVYETKREAAILLARIWETRIYRGVRELSPMLIDLWKSRLDFRPSYGTMAGISEITKFCTATNPVMIDFIAENEGNGDMLEALREYLMGLSYREMIKVEEYMRKNSMDSIDLSGIEHVLGKPKSYILHDLEDPREMYHFFTRRNDNALFRRRSGIDGPKKTIEEYMVCYLIENKLIAPNGGGMNTG